MRKFICFLCIAFGPLATKTFALDPASLIKVTSENNPKCVEYYHYKGEMYCSTTAQSSQPVDPKIKEYEKLNIVFDDRPWQVAWGKQTSELITVEYIPNGDNIDNWNELITSQFFPGLQKKITLKKFAEIVVQHLKDSGFKPIVTFLEDTPEKVIFEFRIESPKNQIQDEIQMITKDTKGLYVLHYVIKKADMGQQARMKWHQNLKNSTIKK